MINDHRPPVPVPVVRLTGRSRLWPLLLVASRRRRLRHVDRVGGGKAVLQPLLQRLLEPALALLLSVALGFLAKLVLGDGFIRNSHAWSPSRRRAAGCHGTTRKPASAFPCFPCRRRQV